MRNEDKMIYLYILHATSYSLPYNHSSHYSFIQSDRWYSYLLPGSLYWEKDCCHQWQLISEEEEEEEETGGGVNPSVQPSVTTRLWRHPCPLLLRLGRPRDQRPPRAPNPRHRKVRQGSDLATELRCKNRDLMCKFFPLCTNYFYVYACTGKTNLDVLHL